MFNFLDAFPRISGRFLWKHTDQRADKEQEGDELATFLSLPTAKAIADEIERLGDCSPTSPSKRSLMDTGLECSVVQFMLANTPQNSLPGHLLRLLARRLSFACKELADIELLEFSQTSAQVLDMLIAANPIKNGSILLDSGLESALLQILKLLGRALGTQSVHGTGTVGVTPKASAQAKLRNRGASSPRGDSTRMLLDVSEAYNENGEQARSFSLRSKLLETFHTLLRLLMTLYVGRPGSRSKLAASSKLGSYGSEEEQIVDEVNATGIPNSLLAKGWSRSQPGSLYVFLQQNSSTVDAISMSARDNILRGLPVREAMVVECAHLFVHFTEGAFCAALTSGEFDPAVCSEIVCSLALVMLHLYKKATSEIVRASLTGIGAQFARLVGCTTRGKKELTLIRELSCSLLLVAKLLRESCALTTELMDSMQFFSRLVGALQVVGNLFEAPHGDREYMQARECCISGLHELEVMISSRSYENTPEMLEFHRPRFERLAEERSVDEFLHCYMGLLETQRDVKATEEGRQSSVTLRYLTEIELSPLKSLMDLESAQLTTSCAYTLLLKCAIGLLPGIETRVFVPSRLRSMHSLVNAGLYSVLFCGRDTDPFHTDSFLRYNALFILHSMLTLPSALPAAESDFDCSSSEVCTLLDVLLNDGKGQTNESIDCQECESGSVRSHLPSMMCLVLLSAVRSPCGGAVVATFLKNDGILALTRVAEKHFLCNEGKCMDRRSEGLSMLAMHLLTVLVMNPVVQESVLVREAKVFISFLKVKSIRVRAEEAFVSLLTHSCPRTEHTRRMKLLVHSARALLKECLKSNLVEGLCKEESEEVIISILRCVCTALRTLFREGLFGPVRLLQNVLCAGENGALDSFFPPLECVSVSWCSVSSTFALSCVASTISLLIQGNSSTRALLFSSISPHELVVSFKAAWFTSQDASWMGFVRCILSVVYEDGDGDADSAGDGEDVGKLKEARGDNVSTAHEDGSCATAFLSSDSLLSTERTSAPYMIQNAELLLQLLHLFTSESEFNEERHNVLDYVLLRIVRTLHISRASLWLVASAGIFEALTALIPLVYSTPLLGKVSELMMEVASHHISVRETKQFLMSIAHARSEEERQMLTLIVIEVLSSASRSLLSRKFEQQNYVAFREGSGPVGLKVVLSDFPLDGYTVCMWLRLESRAIHVSQCIFSLQDTSNRSVLKLSVTKGNILLTFMDARGETVTADLVCSIVPQAWTHVAVVHWDTRFPFTKQGFCLFIDGEQVRRMESVQYPRLGGGFFHVGTCGEDVDHGLCAGNLVGQVAAVHFFCRTLSERMIMDLFREKSGASSVREECSDTVAVYIDPRFGEGGRLHNLAGLPRGKPLQRPLITYEGTLACNAKSIVDSICVLGALQTVVVPLLVLLVNPQLPFQCRVPVARRRAVPEATCKAINDLLKLVEFLLISNIVRADVLEVGLFPMVAHVIQQFISYHCTKLPQRLCNLCIALIPESTLFDAAYSTLFLCGDLLHCLSEAAQLLMVQVQYDACEARADVRHRVRGLDVPHFIVSEIVYTYNGASAHDVEMRLGMFRLLETVMLDVVTRSDAEALKRLVDAVLQQERVGVMGKEVCTDVSLQVEILEHVRILVANRDPLLAALLGKNDFIATLVPFLSDTHHEVRNEVLLLFILVVSRSRRVQELLTPALVSKHEAIHVVRDVSLSWLHDKLRHLTADETLYRTLLAALIGRFNVSLKQQIGLSGEDRVVFAPTLAPILLLMQQCSQKTVKSNAISDIAALVGQDPAAWKSVVSLPGWYMRLADLYLSDEELHKETEGSKSLLESAAFIFSRCIFHSLLQETYGASEMRLLVTYLLKQCACALLNAILLGVVKDYTNYFMNRREHVRSAHLGLGSTLAVCNFASFLFIVEDVLFYSHTASQVLGATCQLESHRKRGYTEIKELVVCCTSDLPDSNHRDGATKDIDEDQNGLREGEQCSRSRYRESVSYFSGDTVPVSVASEGIWLHSELAVRVMCLLTSDGVLLKSGCAVNDNASGPSSSEFAAHEPPGRKGGFIRLFTRLFRVVCTFALRDTELVDNILLCSMRWVELVEEGPGPFSVLAWQTATLKKHSSLSCSMAIVLSLHELLNRRLRFSLKGPSARYRDVNVEILERIKSICTHYKNALSQMQVFRMEVPRSDGGHSVQKHTLQWLCSYSSGDLVREFVEVASRQDYNAFLSQCTLATELDQVTDKSITRSIEQEQEKAVSRLHGMVTSLSMSRKAVLEALEQYLQQVCKSATLDADGSAKGAEAKASAERFTPHAARAIATVTFNAVWVRFLNRCSGTIWDPDPGRQLGTRFVRMMEVEQQLLLRRKLEFDPHGTNHADIMAVGSPPLTVLQKERQPPSLRGGEQLLLSPDGAMGDEDAEGLGVEVMDNATSSGTMHEVKPVVHFSMPCEAPYLMHCWSATLTIRDCELCVFFDDENKAYNQRIAEEAASLLIKPRSIIYPSGRVAMLAPGRRFRMQRTAVELWFRDGRSVLLNFSSAADMRAAVSCIRAAIERHKVPYHSFCVFNENPKKETRLALYTEQWRERTMTNFDYLLWLNFFAGRTLNDLTQYPVFPWVIADYKSEHLDLNSSSTFRDLRLPVGICGGPQCRERVKTRYEETRQMGDVPAHYFTHYSSPAVVIYYMTRIEPFTTLQIILQGGHFDHADRMFHSLPACWHGISTNSQDVRELIPELYYLPELCTNTNGVHFGAKQDGQPMNALDLPPWAHGDPYEFIFRMREALESDHVSSTLNHWIDLIFGYKQRGKEAIEAVNVFNWHSYEDLDKNLSHDIDHKLLIDSLDNIGQTPIQLFTQPHVARRHMEPADPAHCSLKMKTIDLRRICSRINRATRISHVSVLDNDRLLVVCGNGAAVLCRLAVSPVMRNARSTLSRTASARAIWPQKDARHSAPIIISSAAAAAAAHVSTSVLGRVGTAYISTSQNCRASGPTHSSLDVFEEVEKFMAPLPPGLVPNIGNKSGGPCEGENIAVLCLEGEVFVALGGLFDNTLLIRPFGSSSSFPEEYLKAHCGRVVRVVASPDSRYIVSGAEDTTFVVWSVNVQPNRSKLHVNLLFAVYGHEGNPTAMDICPGVDLVVTASSDGMLMFHSIQNSRLERSLRHPSKLSIDRVLIQHTCYLPNILFTSSSDNVVHQVSMNGAVLRSVPAPGHITWWCRTPRQSVLLVTAPVRGDGASEKGGASLHYLHAFYLSTLKSVSWPLHAAEDVLSCCAVHSRNPQVVVCGSSKGSLSLMHVQRES